MRKRGAVPRCGKAVLAAAAVAWLGACDAEPREVYVPAGEPVVELTAGAAKTQAVVGEPIVLHAQRRYVGEWRLVDRTSLADGACWLRRPPPPEESEVADNVRWEAAPAAGARFNLRIRADRTREVVFSAAGTYTLEATFAVWCRPGSPARATPLTIVVRDAPP